MAFYALYKQTADRRVQDIGLDDVLSVLNHTTSADSTLAADVMRVLGNVAPSSEEGGQGTTVPLGTTVQFPDAPRQQMSHMQ